MIATITINWMPILGAVMAVGGVGTLAYQMWAGRTVKKSLTVYDPVIKDGLTSRLADESAPPGAVKWVEDIVKSMGSASADSMIVQLRAGASRDVTQVARISELEGKPVAPEAAE